MRFVRLMTPKGETGDKILICSGLGIIMAAPAFLGWNTFRPNTIGQAYLGWYTNFVSSPLGLGAGPSHLGWLLMTVLSISFVVLLATHDSPKTRRPILHVLAMSFVLASYIFLAATEYVQVRHWANALSTEVCFPNCQFSSPSGRVLTLGIGSSWGPPVAVIASLLASGALIIAATTLAPRPEPSESST